MKECIILAGGLGSRLNRVSSDIPKCLMKVVDRPFLDFLFDFLSSQSFDHIILSLGYGANYISKWLESKKFSFDITLVVENELLGTGGAIKNALPATRSDSVFVMNGDTLFKIDSTKMLSIHEQGEFDITIALKPMQNIQRYGTVELSDNGVVTSFKEKAPTLEGLINGGVYVLNKSLFDRVEKQRFSFETEVLEKTDIFRLQGYISDAYFIDIGTPEDYQKANLDFQNF